MEIIKLKDNSKKQKRELSSPSGQDDFLNIANISIEDAVKNNENLLIFPQCLGDFGDEIGKNRICSFHKEDESFYISTGNVMGFVGYGSIELNITSRFSIGENDYFLHYLLQQVFCNNLFDWKHSTDEEDIFDFLVYLFPYFLNRALFQGLYKTYTHHEYNDSKLKGPIDINRHIRQNNPFSGKIAYSTREYTYDNPVTQLIRHTIEYIKTKEFGSKILDNKETLDNVRAVIENTPSYSSRDLKSVLNANIRPVQHPYYTEYTILQKICIKILNHEGLKFGETSDNQIYGILFDGAWLWEEYIALVTEKVFEHYTYENGNFYLLMNKKTGKETQKIIPDYISYDKKFVADAKYIPLRNAGNAGEERSREIFYKTIMYMLRFNSKKGFLFYPNNEQVEPTQFEVMDTDCEVFEIPLCVPKENDINFEEFSDLMKKAENEFISNIQRFIQEN